MLIFPALNCFNKSLASDVVTAETVPQSGAVVIPNCHCLEIGHGLDMRQGTLAGGGLDIYVWLNRLSGQARRKGKQMKFCRNSVLKAACLARVAGFLTLAVFLVVPRPVGAHCDTVDGPVVQAGIAALKNREIRPVLMWIKPDVEAELEAAFARTLAVREKDGATRELADQFFLETLVRLHRSGEGAPYTGIKPSGADIGRIVPEADKSLRTGSARQLVDIITKEAAAGIQERFELAQEKQKRAEESPEAGREFVAAYVDYVHYVEGLHEKVVSSSAHEHKPASGDQAGSARPTVGCNAH
jgi:hypothetical protein